MGNRGAGTTRCQRALTRYNETRCGQPELHAAPERTCRRVPGSGQRPVKPSVARRQVRRPASFASPDLSRSPTSLGTERRNTGPPTAARVRVRGPSAARAWAPPTPPRCRRRPHQCPPYGPPPPCSRPPRPSHGRSPRLPPQGPSPGRPQGCRRGDGCSRGCRHRPSFFGGP